MLIGSLYWWRRNSKNENTRYQTCHDDISLNYWRRNLFNKNAWYIKLVMKMDLYIVEEEFFNENTIILKLSQWQNLDIVEEDILKGLLLRVVAFYVPRAGLILLYNRWMLQQIRHRFHLPLRTFPDTHFTLGQHRSSNHFEINISIIFFTGRNCQQTICQTKYAQLCTLQ